MLPITSWSLFLKNYVLLFDIVLLWLSLNEISAIYSLDLPSKLFSYPFFEYISTCSIANSETFSKKYPRPVQNGKVTWEQVSLMYGWYPSIQNFRNLRLVIGLLSSMLIASTVKLIFFFFVMILAIFYESSLYSGDFLEFYSSVLAGLNRWIPKFYSLSYLYSLEPSLGLS